MMIKRHLVILTSALGLGVLTLWSIPAQTQEVISSAEADERGIFDQVALAGAAEPLPQQNGVEPRARGPVHEAFAEPVSVRPQPGPVIAKKPPDPIEELPPEEKPEGEDVQWIPGYWAHDEDGDPEFLWVSGLWRLPPPGRQWVPGHWTEVTGGWQWVPGFWTVAEAGDIQVVPVPPEPIPEAQPPQPHADSVYVGGHYVYHEARYMWRPGFWCDHRPGWVWVPAHYCWTSCGYVYVPGYWDYALRDRGLLFAPVAVQPAILTVGFTYTPRYVVHDTGLQTALFIRSGTGGYYFGDYYGARQTNLFISWTDYRGGYGGSDYLFAYYRTQHRNNPVWERDLRALQIARARGQAPLPPRSLAQQAVFARGGAGAPAQLRNNMLLAPVNRVNPQVVRVQRQNAAQLAEQRRQAQQIQAVSLQRRQAEAALRAPAGGAPRPQGPQSLKVALPKPPVAKAQPTVVRRPPPPPPAPAPKKPAPVVQRPDPQPKPAEAKKPAPPAEAKKPAAPPAEAKKPAATPVVKKAVPAPQPAVKKAVPQPAPKAPAVNSPPPALRKPVPQLKAAAPRPPVPEVRKAPPPPQKRPAQNGKKKPGDREE